MKPNNPSQNERPTADDPVWQALADVSIPCGLEGRLLDAVGASFPDENAPAQVVATTSGQSSFDTADETQQKRQSPFSRRRLLTAGLAAGVGGVLAGGRIAWSRRPLQMQDVAYAVNESLESRDWVAWDDRLQAEHHTPFPGSLRRSKLWQLRPISIAEVTVAYNMSLPGCAKSVLFAVKTTRGLAVFPKAPPSVPQLTQTGIWSHVSMWKAANQNVLYVLAIQSDDVQIKRDYQRLFRSGPAVSLA